MLYAAEHGRYLVCRKAGSEHAVVSGLFAYLSSHLSNVHVESFVVCIVGMV